MRSGYRSYAAIAEYGRTYKQLRKALGFRHKKTPSAATLYNLFHRLDLDALEETLKQWAVAALEDFYPTRQGGLTAVAIDGKTLRGSQKQDAKITHLMSIVSHELGITLTQKAMSAKTHELPTSLELLKCFDVFQKVVTADALLTHRSFCESVLASGGDYVLPVKENQKEMFHAIKRLFQRPPDAKTFRVSAYQQLKAEHQDWQETLDTAQTIDKAHGRLETRRLTASTALNAYLRWPGSRKSLSIPINAKTYGQGKSHFRHTMVSRV